MPWHTPPTADFDAVLLTSANAARHAGPGLARYLSLPCYCVGDATAAAARDAGFEKIRTGPSDGAAVLALAASDRIGSLLHLAGREHMGIADAQVRIERRIVYGSDPVPLSDEAIAALRAGALALLHSPRAAARFAALVGEARLDPGAIPILAISPAAANAAGQGWRAVLVAPEPRDPALLALAAELCQNG